jgi:hypothetical protein
VAKRPWLQTRTPAALCPGCGELLTAASDLETEARPVPGAFTVCIHCAAILRFDAELRPQTPGFGVLEALALTEPETAERLRLHQTAVRTLPRSPKVRGPGTA